MIAQSTGNQFGDEGRSKVIKVIASATEVPELLFMAHALGVTTIVADSFFLGMAITREIKKKNPRKNLALFDSAQLFQIVEYAKADDLKAYMKENDFEIGYKVNVRGKGIPIQ